MMTDRRAPVSSPATTLPSPFQRGSFTSPSMAPAKIQTDLFNPSNGSLPSFPPTSSRTERRPPDYGVPAQLPLSTSDPTQMKPEPRQQNPTILLRRLPRNLGHEALQSMLLFAKDLIGAEFVASQYPEDVAYSCAIAQFKSMPSALEAKERLSGKPNATNDANMLVEVVQNNISSRFGSRRNTIDAAASRQQNSSASSSGSASNERLQRQTSRFNGTFQSIDNISPPQSSANLTNGDFPVPESSTHFKSLFSPQSPLGNSSTDQQRISGKSVINDDAVDDETGELLRDPVAYARNDHQTARRTTNPQLPTAAFGGLTLGTTMSNGNNHASGSGANLTSPRALPSHQAPGPVISPGSQSAMSPNGSYSNSNFPRHNYPPANPADQNPPCNTLYVGNLPIDTSEDELKALFSKQRGYKRLCFRTKQNGPMCFVEFEDVSFATKALHELYGYLLHNSVKGGIRLSFSKNPLGVRTGQMNGMGGPTSPMSPQALSPGFGNGIVPPPGFASSGGPPPGLSGQARGPSFGPPPIPDSLSSMYPMSSYGMGQGPLGPQIRLPPVSTGYAPASSTHAAGGMSAGYSMMTR